MNTLIGFQPTVAPAYSASSEDFFSEMRPKIMNKLREQEELVTALAQTLKSLLGKLVCMGGTMANVNVSKTDYVVNGYTFVVESGENRYAFWLGVNGPRLFFVTYVVAEKSVAKEVFNFCLGGAEKVGWGFNFEPTGDGEILSIWGSCMTDVSRPLAQFSPTVRANGQPIVELTAHGVFWMTDIAMMAQSLIRTSERQKIVQPLGVLPAPL